MSVTSIELFCVFRLLQNRESAKKCRIKKKANFEVIHKEVESLKKDKKEMLEKINELTLLLYSKVDENNNLQRKVEQLTAIN